MKVYHTYAAIDVAHLLIEQGLKKGKQLTNLHLQKMVYVCHGISLAHFDRPLILEDVQAWQYGPVVPSVYFNFKEHGSSVIKLNDRKDVELDSDSHEIVCNVIDMLGDYTGWQLVDLTHQEGSPWHKVWKADKKIRAIPDEVIKQHYLEIKQNGATSCL